MSDGGGWTTLEVAQFLTRTGSPVKPATIRQWAHRGHITPTGRDNHGRPLYDPREAVNYLLARRGLGMRA